MKITITGFITSKESESIADCADRYAYSIENLKFAISDGVSKSFFSKYWAEILVNKFVLNKKIEPKKFLKESQEEWYNKISEILKNPDVKWFTQNAYNNKSPALATFVGLQIFEEKRQWQASALGDSFLFFLSKDYKSFKERFEFSSKERGSEFDNYPDYFSSYGDKFKGKVKQTFKNQLKDGTFYLMTDALAEWFINQKENSIGKIEVWNNQLDFVRFVAEERLNGKLGNDDSAILIIKISECDVKGVEYSDENVSDINSLILADETTLKKNVSELEISNKHKSLSTDSNLTDDSLSENKQRSNSTNFIIAIEEELKQSIQNFSNIAYNLFFKDFVNKIISGKEKISNKKKPEKSKNKKTNSIVNKF